STFPDDWNTPYIFPTEQGEPLTPSNLGRQVGRKNKELGTHIKIHGLRHLCATEFLRNTGNLALTAKLLGHTDVKTTSAFYEHLTFDDLRNAHSKANVVKSVLKPSKARNKRG
ncbi:tyrosine-type recombinase/integrase, partial [Aminobacterium mobile]|uniref:tyrosine-type recombinase/integrase n=1 Tax=Aminobacterium mobile TaxID=81467 RepID=UPI0033148446